MLVLVVATICSQILQHQAMFITLRDANFYEEDAMLNASLYQRMAVNNPANEPRVVEVREGSKSPLRARYEYAKLNPTNLNTKLNMIQAMKQLIYSTQYRLKDLEPLTRKYSDDIRYRVSFVYCRLKTLEEEMEEQYSAFLNQVKDNYKTYYGIRFVIAEFYYEHDLRRFVDVVYIVEHFYKLHAEYLRVLKDEKKALEEGIKANEEREKAAAQLPATDESGLPITSESPGGVPEGVSPQSPLPGPSRPPPTTGYEKSSGEGK